MRWIIPDPGIFPHSVSITRNTWGQDLDGGRMIASSVTFSGWAAFVQQEPGRHELDDSPEIGLRRSSQVKPFLIDFRENPHLKVDDTVTWIDDTGDDNPGVHVIQVNNVSNMIGLRGTWHVRGQETV